MDLAVGASRRTLAASALLEGVIVAAAVLSTGCAAGMLAARWAVGTWPGRILAGEPIEIWGDGSVVRDYFAVSDLAELCVRAGTSRNEGAYNAGSGYGLSINEVIEAIRKVTGRDFKTIYKPGRPVDVPYSVLDCSRAKKDFGWECKAGFDSELRRAFSLKLTAISMGLMCPNE